MPQLPLLPQALLLQPLRLLRLLPQRQLLRLLRRLLRWAAPHRERAQQQLQAQEAQHPVLR